MADEEGGDEGAPPPENGTPGGSRGVPPKPPSPEQYETWWLYYRDGARTGKSLTKKAKARRQTITWAIRHGWPEVGLAPLSSRAELFDRQQAARVWKKAAEQGPVGPAVTAEVVEPRELAAKRIDQRLSALGELIDAAINTVKLHMPAANYVRYRPVPDVDEKGVVRRDRHGRPQMIPQQYVNGVDTTQALRHLSLAARDAAVLHRLMHGAPVPQEPDVPKAIEGVEALTDEHLERLRKGEIPDDLTAAQLAAALLEAERLVGGG